jgi:putative transposase
VKFAFIEAHRPMWRLPRLCSALRVSPSGYFAWRRRPDSPRHDEDRALTARIQVIHGTSRKTYGSPRVHRELKAQGTAISRKRVERLMRNAGIQVKPQARFVVTTDSDHDLPVAENLLQQDFTASAPNQRWVTDITYVPTGEGWLYVAAIIDLFSRRVVGWAMQNRMDRSLVMAALSMAIGNRQPPAGLIHHSDRGSQYASHDYRAALKANGLIASMSRRACCYDNAAMESFWHTLKVELIHRRTFQTRAEATQAIFEYIEVFYNRTRLHSSIGYISPVDFERQHSAVA